MVVKEEKQRLHRLLADAIPLLCKSGLPPKATFCIEALIGITLEHDEVLLVSFKQEICADETVLPDNCFETVAIETEEEEEEIAIKPVNKSCNMAARKKLEKQTDQSVDKISEVSVNRIESKKILSTKESDVLSVPARVKLEAVDVKMEDDVEMSSTANASGYGYSGEAAGDGLAWNLYEYDAQAGSVSAIFVDEAVDGGEEEAARGKWNGSGRPGNKTVRRRTGRTAPSSSSFSNVSNECTYATADGSTGEWNRKRKDGRNVGTAAAASHNSSSISLKSDAGLGCQAFEPSVAAQDSSVGQSMSDPQPLDDRVSLEQTCKILSSYRFASSDDNLYSCHICEAKLRGRQTLYEHIRGTHLCAHIYRCPNCGLSFKWRSGLQRHRTRCPNTGSTQVLMPPVTDM